MYNELSGYTAPCSEFNDDSAEIMVKNISFHEETIPDETGKHIPAIQSLPHPQAAKSDPNTLMTALGELWLAGSTVEWIVNLPSGEGILGETSVGGTVGTAWDDIQRRQVGSQGV